MQFPKGVLLMLCCLTAPISGVDTWLTLATNSSTVDLLLRPETADKVKEFLGSNGLTFDVVIDNLQAAIDTENPTMTPEEMEELEGRKGKLLNVDTSMKLNNHVPRSSYTDVTNSRKTSVAVHSVCHTQRTDTYIRTIR
jgi:hypothetical protein